jgi:hypothetical protein
MADDDVAKQKASGLRASCTAAPTLNIFSTIRSNDIDGAKLVS